MKKILVYSIFAIMIFSFYSPVKALPTTYERTDSNLGVNKNYVINSSNKNNVINTPYVDANQLIYDFANLLTDTEELDIYNKAKEFQDNHQQAMVIVTIDKNNKKNAKVYSQDFYDYNDFGINYDKYSGIIFLIDMDTREMYITTTGESILIYDDYRIDKMLDSAYNYISKGKYYESTTAFISSATQYMKKGIPNSNKDKIIDENGDYVDRPKEFSIPWIATLCISGIVLLVEIIIFNARNKMVRKATKAGQYLDRNSINYTKRLDTFLTTHTTSYKIDTDTSSSGGSSISSGSSGGSHGGGGRSF